VKVIGKEGERVMMRMLNWILDFFDLKLIKTTSMFVSEIKAREGNKELVGIEIGTWEGRNAEHILKTLNMKKLYLIDPYAQYEEYPDFKNQQLVNAQIEAIKAVSQFRDKVVWINKFSDEAVKEIKEQVDFVYIDGNHEYEYVKKDIANYYPLVKEGGYIGGHDIQSGYSPHIRGVLKAVLEFVKDKQLFILGADWWVIKGGEKNVLDRSNEVNNV